LAAAAHIKKDWFVSYCRRASSFRVSLPVSVSAPLKMRHRRAAIIEKSFMVCAITICVPYALECAATEILARIGKNKAKQIITNGCASAEVGAHKHFIIALLF
jgi:hypothetical protein